MKKLRSRNRWFQQVTAALEHLLKATNLWISTFGTICQNESAISVQNENEKYFLQKHLKIQFQSTRNNSIIHVVINNLHAFSCFKRIQRKHLWYRFIYSTFYSILNFDICLQKMLNFYRYSNGWIPLCDRAQLCASFFFSRILPALFLLWQFINEVWL